MTRFASKYPVTSGAAMSYATHPSAPCPESSCLPLRGGGGHRAVVTQVLFRFPCTGHLCRGAHPDRPVQVASFTQWYPGTHLSGASINPFIISFLVCRKTQVWEGKTCG